MPINSLDMVGFMHDMDYYILNMQNAATKENVRLVDSIFLYRVKQLSQKYDRQLIDWIIAAFEYKFELENNEIIPHDKYTKGPLIFPLDFSYYVNEIKDNVIIDNFQEEKKYIAGSDNFITTNRDIAKLYNNILSETRRWIGRKAEFILTYSPKLYKKMRDTIISEKYIDQTELREVRKNIIYIDSKLSEAANIEYDKIYIKKAISNIINKYNINDFPKDQFDRIEWIDKMISQLNKKIEELQYIGQDISNEIGEPDKYDKLINYVNEYISDLQQLKRIIPEYQEVIYNNEVMNRLRDKKIIMKVNEDKIYNLGPLLLTKKGINEMENKLLAYKKEIQKDNAFDLLTYTPEKLNSLKMRLDYVDNYLYDLYEIKNMLSIGIDMSKVKGKGKLNPEDRKKIIKSIKEDIQQEKQELINPDNFVNVTKNKGVMPRNESIVEFLGHEPVLSYLNTSAQGWNVPKDIRNTTQFLPLNKTESVLRESGNLSYTLPEGQFMGRESIPLQEEEGGLTLYKKEEGKMPRVSEEAEYMAWPNMNEPVRLQPVPERDIKFEIKPGMSVREYQNEKGRIQSLTNKRGEQIPELNADRTPQRVSPALRRNPDFIGNVPNPEFNIVSDFNLSGVWNVNGVTSREAYRRVQTKDVKVNAAKSLPSWGYTGFTQSGGPMLPDAPATPAGKTKKGAKKGC